MPWYYHGESDSVFFTEHPMAMESFDAALCTEITEEQARELQSKLTKGQPTMDIEGSNTIEGTAVRVEMGDDSQRPAEHAAAATLITDDKLARIYLKIRDAKKAFVDAHEEELRKQFEEPMAMIQTELKKRLLACGGKGLKTEYGTVYLSETLKVSLADGGAFIPWAKQHDCLENFYEQRIKVGEVKKYMEDHNGEVPPGLNVFRETEARVRKPTKRGASAVGDPVES